VTYEQVKHLKLEVLYRKGIGLVGVGTTDTGIGIVPAGMTITGATPTLSCELAIVSGSTVKVAVVVGDASIMMPVPGGVSTLLLLIPTLKAVSFAKATATPTPLRVLVTSLLTTVTVP
jgi:hypothetical protein